MNECDAANSPHTTLHEHTKHFIEDLLPSWAEAAYYSFVCNFIIVECNVYIERH